MPKGCWTSTQHSGRNRSRDTNHWQLSLTNISFWHPEIKRLTGQGITPPYFPQYELGTTFNLRYIYKQPQMYSENLKFPEIKGMFRSINIFSRRDASCTNETKFIQDKIYNKIGCQDGSIKNSWYYYAVMGASFMFGLQTYKERGDGATNQHAKWCCLTGLWNEPCVIP
jgi:hypothetical protein